MAKLNAQQIKAALAAVPAWTKHGAVISRTYEFEDFPAAIQFVDAVAKLAERAWHHPDIDIRWNKVRLALTTHDEGGLTAKDFELAAKFDQLTGQRTRK
ncbi:MAG: 4a-hydroxytetrahydrobiopterin dehydratase [Verrucomicrobia bacterium]|nr:4a-hydroxytetrahydrobiopterin dehydratase [Verrucomicrobiota bacterium]